MAIAIPQPDDVSSAHTYRMEKETRYRTLGWVLLVFGVLYCAFTLYLVMTQGLRVEDCLRIAADPRDCGTITFRWLRWIWLLMGIIFSLQGIIMLYRVSTTRLVTSPEGVEYYDGALYYQVSTSWPNIMGIEPRRLSGPKYYDCLILREPVTVQGPGWARPFWPKQAKQEIPLGQNWPQWRDSSMKQDIEHYAPSLLAKSEPPS